MIPRVTIQELCIVAIIVIAVEAFGFWVTMILLQ